MTARVRVIVGVLVFIITLALLLSLPQWGSSSATTPASEVVTSPARFWVMFILGGLIVLGWAGFNYSRHPPNTPFAARVAGMRPPIWAFVVFLGVPSFHWLFWAISPEVWSAWVTSRAFWPMNAAIVLAAFFVSQPNHRVARYAGFALAALVMIAIITSSTSYLGKTGAPQASTTNAQAASCEVLPAQEIVKVVVATKEGWSKRLCFPSQMAVDWRATNPAGRYKMRTQKGEFTFTPEKSDRVSSVAEASFMAIGDGPEEIRVFLHSR